MKHQVIHHIFVVKYAACLISVGPRERKLIRDRAKRVFFQIFMDACRPLQLLAVNCEHSLKNHATARKCFSFYQAKFMFAMRYTKKNQNAAIEGLTPLSEKSHLFFLYSVGSYFGRATPLSVQLFNFHAVFRKIWPNNRLITPFGKSRIYP